MSWYDRYMLPRVLDAACGMKIVGEQRAKVVGLAHGVVLEPGIGGGLNLPFYQTSGVSKLIGVDPSIELGIKARQRSATVPFPVELWCHGQPSSLILRLSGVLSYLAVCQAAVRPGTAT